MCLRPDMGYVQGMSFLGAILLLQMEQEDAFVALANLLSHPLLKSMFSLDEATVSIFCKVQLNLESDLEAFKKLFSFSCNRWKPTLRHMKSV